MNILIEVYQGHHIYFIPESERFSFRLDEGHWREKQSFSACKTAIREFIKLNSEFKPFKIRRIRDGLVFDVVSKTKSNRFVLSNKNTIGKYELDAFIMFDELHDLVYPEIKKIEEQINILDFQIRELKDPLKAMTLDKIFTELA